MKNVKVTTIGGGSGQYVILSSLRDLKKTSKIMLMILDSVGVNMRLGGRSPTPRPKPPKKVSSELKTTVGSITTME